MKAITLRQPWASLVAVGAKRIKTSKQQTSYRGPLAIYASTVLPGGIFRAKRPMPEPFASPLREAGHANERGDVILSYLPRGSVIATCTLVDICAICAIPHSDDVGYAQPVVEDGATIGRIIAVQEPERTFDDYTPGRWAWLLADVQPLDPPVPAEGGQKSLWDWDG
jgi:hypothetical protein